MEVRNQIKQVTSGGYIRLDMYLCQWLFDSLGIGK